MKLIDADEAIKRLGNAHFKNYGNAIMVIRETPTVEAIPVQWLYDLAEKKEEEKDIKLSAMIKGVVALWHREKQNDSD